MRCLCFIHSARALFSYLLEIFLFVVLTFLVCRSKWTQYCYWGCSGADDLSWGVNLRTWLIISGEKTSLIVCINLNTTARWGVIAFYIVSPLYFYVGINYIVAGVLYPATSHSDASRWEKFKSRSCSSWVHVIQVRLWEDRRLILCGRFSEQVSSS